MKFIIAFENFTLTIYGQKELKGHKLNYARINNSAKGKHGVAFDVFKSHKINVKS